MLFSKVKSDQQFFMLHNTVLFNLDEQLIWCFVKDLLPKISHLKEICIEHKLYQEM